MTIRVAPRPEFGRRNRAIEMDGRRADRHGQVQRAAVGAEHQGAARIQRGQLTRFVCSGCVQGRVRQPGCDGPPIPARPGRRSARYARRGRSANRSATSAHTAAGHCLTAAPAPGWIATRRRPGSWPSAASQSAIQAWAASVISKRIGPGSAAIPGASAASKVAFCSTSCRSDWYGSVSVRNGRVSGQS